MLAQPDSTHIAMIVGDDRAPAPIIMYVGEKQAGGSFLERNGLAKGYIYVFVADDGTNSPEDTPLFLGTGTTKSGSFVKIEHYLEGGLAPDYDSLGFATQVKQDALSIAVNAFFASRPEDVSTNPANPYQVIMQSTGREGIFDNKEIWGQTILIEVNFDTFVAGEPVPAELTILYDGNDTGDFGLRSPDNGVWGQDGYLYGKFMHYSIRPFGLHVLHCKD